MIEEAQRVKELGFSTSSLRGTLPGFEKPYSYTSLCFYFLILTIPGLQDATLPITILGDIK